MKRYIIALLLGIGLLAVQAASAATLSLESGSRGVQITGDNTGTTTAGGFIDVIIEAANGELADLLISFTNVGGAFEASFFGNGANAGTNKAGSLFVKDLAAGTYQLGIIDSSNFKVDVSGSAIGDVPVPAAVWLFGSAMLGLLGAKRRKSSPTLAA